MRRQDVKDYLDSFHAKYVITLIDKTTSNIGVVCKKFYIKTYCRNVGYGGRGVGAIPMRYQSKTKEASILISVSFRPSVSQDFSHYHLSFCPVIGL